MNACEACYICAALHKAMCSSDYRIKAIELQHSAYSNDFTFYENSDIILFYYNLYCNGNQNYISEMDRCASRLNIRKIIGRCRVKTHFYYFAQYYITIGLS